MGGSVLTKRANSLSIMAFYYNPLTKEYNERERGGGTRVVGSKFMTGIQAGGVDKRLTCY